MFRAFGAGKINIPIVDLLCRICAELRSGVHLLNAGNMRCQEICAHVHQTTVSMTGTYMMAHFIFASTVGIGVDGFGFA